MTSGDSETTSQFGTWKQLLGYECGRVARGYGNCWKLRQVCNMMENALCILFVIFPHNSNKPRPQTESCLFSNLEGDERQISFTV